MRNKHQIQVRATRPNVDIAAVFAAVQQVDTYSCPVMIAVYHDGIAAEWVWDGLGTDRGQPYIHNEQVVPRATAETMEWHEIANKWGSEAAGRGLMVLGEVPSRVWDRNEWVPAVTAPVREGRWTSDGEWDDRETRHGFATAG